MGVRMLPCGVLIVPARAQLWGHSASIVNENGDMRSRWIPFYRDTLEYFLQLVLSHMRQEIAQHTIYTQKILLRVKNTHKKYIKMQAIQ